MNTILTSPKIKQHVSTNRSIYEVLSFIALSIFVSSILFSIFIPDREKLGNEYCSDKNGVAGWSTRYGYPVVHCKNGEMKAISH